jgi:hypothetical protein
VLEPRETLLRSATAEPNGDLISVHFDFSASPNVKDLQIGKIKNIEKGGWEYLWVWWANDLPANELTKKAKQVNIEQVKRYGSFWGFGLPRRFT